MRNYDKILKLLLKNLNYYKRIGLTEHVTFIPPDTSLDRAINDPVGNVSGLDLIFSITKQIWIYGDLL